MKEINWIKDILLGQRSGVEQGEAGMIHLQISFFLKYGLNPQPRKSPSFSQRMENHSRVPQFLTNGKTERMLLKFRRQKVKVSSFSTRLHAGGGPVGGAVAEVTGQ